MRCISPITLRTKDGLNTVPCSKCNYCLANRRADWSFRLYQEFKVAASADFLTFTYEDEKIPLNPVSGIPELRKNDYQLFKKRLRKEAAKYSSLSLRYYACGEYGTKTMRPHYHTILFNLPREVLPKLDSIWSHGFCHRGDVSPASIHYVTKYVINKYDDFEGVEKPFALMSRRPALGANYLDTHTRYHQSGLKDYTNVNGHKGRIPRYYRDKIFSSFERQVLLVRNLESADVKYWQSVEKLSAHSKDAHNYYFERISHQHEQLKNNVNKLNKF